MHCLLEFTTFMIAVVVAIGDDDVVAEADAHQFAGFADAGGQRVVLMAGTQAAGGVVVADGKDGGVGQNGFAHDNADVDRDLADASVGNTQPLDEAEVLVHEQYPEFLDVQVLHQGVHIVVDACCRAEFKSLFRFLHLAPLAQFTGCQYADGLCLANAIKLAQFTDGFLAQGVQIVVAIVHDALHEVYGTLLRTARTYQNGQQLSIRQRFGP